MTNQHVTSMSELNMRTLASQIRREEKRRLLRVVLGTGLILVVLLLLLFRMQANDRSLRQTISRSCEARNANSDLQRAAYAQMASSATDIETASRWSDIINKLPSNVDCSQFLQH